MIEYLTVRFGWMSKLFFVSIRVEVQVFNTYKIYVADIIMQECLKEFGIDTHLR